jgi:hypothetical protein
LGKVRETILKIKIVFQKSRKFIPAEHAIFGFKGLGGKLRFAFGTLPSET